MWNPFDRFSLIFYLPLFYHFFKILQLICLLFESVLIYLFPKILNQFIPSLHGLVSLTYRIISLQFSKAWLWKLFPHNNDSSTMIKRQKIRKIIDFNGKIGSKTVIVLNSDIIVALTETVDMKKHFFILQFVKWS